LGALLSDLDKREQAEAAYRQALTLREKLVADFPAVPQYRLELARSHNNLGYLLAGLGKRAESEAAYRQALAILEKLAADFPAVPQYRQDVAVWNEYASVLLLDRNDDGYREVCKRVLERFGKTKEAEEKYLVARILSLAPNQVADPRETIKRVQEVVDQKSEQGWYRHTLAVACYRADRFEEAVGQCEQSMKRDPDWGGHVVNWLLLAMAHQRRGHAKEAQEWLDKAVQWIDKASEGKKEKRIDLPVLSWSDSLEVQLLLREADGLLKTDKKAIPKK